MGAAYDPTQDHFLTGMFAPMQRETGPTPVQVIAGKLPEALAGTYYRNGPNPRFPPIGSYTYPLDGDGMVHAVDFADGRASYTNRFVRTPSIAAEERAGRALWGGVMTPTMPSPADAAPVEPGRYKDLPDINVVQHAGRLLALAEGERPFLLGNDLATVGPYYFDGKLPHGLCAHPKIDPATGELVVFRYGFEPPFLTWAVVGADGRLTRSEQVIDVDGPYMIHDFAITSSWIVIYVCPAVFEMSVHGAALNWAPERGTRIALVRRDGTQGVRWIETDAFWVWHFANAFEEVDSRGATSIVVDHPRWTALPIGGGPATCTVVRARLDPARGRATFDAMFEGMAEFPRIDDRLVGRRHRYFHAAGKDERGAPGMWNLLHRFDTQTGSIVTRDAGDTRIGEAIFAPSTARSGETDGYVITYHYVGDATELLILNAADIAGEPAAVLRMPQRVPFGLHGCWVPASDR